MKCQYLQTQRTTCRLRAGVVQIPCRHRADTVPAGCCISGYYCTYLCCCACLCRRAPSADNAESRAPSSRGCR